MQVVVAALLGGLVALEGGGRVLEVSGCWVRMARERGREREGLGGSRLRRGGEGE